MDRNGFELADIYQSGMMMQRDKEIRIRGRSKAGMVHAQLYLRGRDLARDVDREPLDDDRPYPMIADEQFTVAGGTFEVRLPAQAAGTLADVMLWEELGRDGDPEHCAMIILKNILFGDLYMAMGQSNMEFFMRYEANWAASRKLKKDPGIRMYNTPQIAFEGQTRELPGYGEWFEEHDEPWAYFSAPGWAFARKIREHEDVPVGIIGCNWGGTPACAWIREDYLTQAPLDIFTREYQQEVSRYTPEELERLSLEGWAWGDDYHHVMEGRTVMYGLSRAEQQEWVRRHQNTPLTPMGPWHHYRPSGLYHTMVGKVAPLPVKGILWYQGESDQEHADIYDRTMDALVRCLRETWQDDLPFFFVQLAPFDRWLECTGRGYVKVRWAQERAASRIPQCYMASIMDLGEQYDIHPKEKKKVGERLALLALKHVYDENVLCDPPYAVSAHLDGSRIVLTMANAGDGMIADEQGSVDFSLTIGDTGTAELMYDEEDGPSDELYRKAYASDCIKAAHAGGDQVIIDLELPARIDTLDGKPLVISYCCWNYCESHLWNSAGLAARPFRIEVQ